MTLLTVLGLLIVTAGATLLGSLPVVFHHFLNKQQIEWWESFGGGVMISASFFSLYHPAFVMLRESALPLWPLLTGSLWGAGLILLASALMHKWSLKEAHRRAFLVVFAMGLHNIPEGMAVGVDVSAVGWQKALPLTVAIFIQNLPEGLVTSMSFLLSGFSVRASLFANGVTAMIEGFSALAGFQVVSMRDLDLPFMLSFSGAFMTCVVLLEFLEKRKRNERERVFFPGFLMGLCVCAFLDLAL